MSSFGLPPLHPPTRFHLSPVLWLSKTALFAGQHGAASVASASRAPFSQLFNSPQRSIIGMTVTRKEGEIKQNGSFKKYYFIMDDKNFRSVFLASKKYIAEAV